MIVTENLVMIPSRKIIMDLALRDCWTEEAISPYNGFKAEIDREQKKVEDVDLLAILEKQDDFDATKKRPSIGICPKKRSKVEKLLVEVYLNHLEEINESWLSSYLLNIVYRTNRADRDSVASERRMSKTHSLFYNDEDGEVTSRADLLVEKRINAEAEKRARDEIIYHLKRLNNISKLTGFSYISYIIAYLTAYRKIQKDVYTTKLKPQPNDVLMTGKVWKVSKEGKFLSVVLDYNGENKYLRTTLHKWACEEITDAYTEDMVRLIYCCNELEIELEKEQVADFNGEFIDKLSTNYLTSNSKYFKYKDYRPINKTALAKLKNISINDYEAKVVTEYIEDDKPKLHRFKELLVDYTNECVDIVLDSGKLNLSRDRSTIMLQMTAFKLYYNQIQSKLGNKLIDRITFNDDNLLLNTDNNEVKGILTSEFTKDNDQRVKEEINVAVLHISGYLIAVTDCENVYFYMDIVDAVMYLKSKISNEHDDYYGGGKSFGKWSKLMI